MIKLWNVSSRDLRKTLQGHSDMVSAVMFARDTLISGSWDHVVQMWDVETGESRGKLNTREDAVIAMAVAPSAKSLLTVSANRSLKLWKAADVGARPIATFGKYRNFPWCAAFSPDGTQVAVGSGGNSDETDLYVYDVSTAAEKLHVRFSGNVRSIAYSPSGEVLAMGFMTNELLLINSASGKEIDSFSDARQGVNSVAFSPDGLVLATGSLDKRSGCTTRRTVSFPTRSIATWTRSCRSLSPPIKNA